MVIFLVIIIVIVMLLVIVITIDRPDQPAGPCRVAGTDVLTDDHLLTLKAARDDH